MKIFNYLFCISVLFTISSCNTNELEAESGREENSSNERPHGVYTVLDTLDSNHVKTVIYSADENGFAIANMTDDRIERLDVLKSQEEMMSFAFNEDRQLEHIGIVVNTDTLVVLLSNYVGNKVDVAMKFGDEILMEKEIECDVEWSQVVLDSYNGSSTRGAVFDSNRWKEEFGSAQSFIDYAWKTVIKPTLSLYEKTKNKEQIISELILWKANIISPLLSENAEQIVSYAEMGEMVYDVASSISKTGSIANPWTFLALNHEEIRNFGEILGEFLTESTLNLIEGFEETIELLRGMVDSGYGDLKVTLSWNFYGDIDLHAIEPSSEHLYWSEKYSQSSDGYLDVDNTKGGAGAVENIYWKEPKDGTYHIFIDYFGRSSYNWNKESGSCMVSVTYKGKGEVVNVHMTPETHDKSVFIIKIPEGIILKP